MDANVANVLILNTRNFSAPKRPMLSQHRPAVLSIFLGILTLSFLQKHIQRFHLVHPANITISALHDVTAVRADFSWVSLPSPRSRSIRTHRCGKMWVRLIHFAIFFICAPCDIAAIIRYPSDRYARSNWSAL